MKKKLVSRVIKAVLFILTQNMQTIICAGSAVAVVLMYGSSLVAPALKHGISAALVAFVWMMVGLAAIDLTIRPLTASPTGNIIYTAFTNVMVVLGTLAKVALTIGLIHTATPFETALIDGIISAFTIYGLIPKMVTLFWKPDEQTASA